MSYIKGKYSRKELDAVAKPKLPPTEKFQQIVNDLIERAGKGDKLSLAEKEYAHGFIEVTYDKETGERLDIDNFPTLREYTFKKLYIEYHDDLNGIFPVYNLFGLVPFEQKKKDVKKLNEFFEEWKLVVSKSNHREELLNIVAAEARIELKQLTKIADEEKLDYRIVNEKEKSIVLHSRYLYLTVKEFFEENEGKSIVSYYHGKEIEINTYSLVHIMFRHYAGAIKQFDTAKSFHLDTSIDFRTLPLALKHILEKISNSNVLIAEQPDFIPFRFRNNLYAIWTGIAEKSVKGKQVKFTRLQTYYPIEDAVEINRINTERMEIKINDELSVFKLK